jgi:hypothetical protein
MKQPTILETQSHFLLHLWQKCNLSNFHYVIIKNKTLQF